MSMLLKDGLIKACADAYRAASGTTDGVKAGELAGLIAALTTGGEGSSDIYIGTYTPSEDVSNIEVEHGFGSSDILAAVIFVENIDAENPPASKTLCTGMFKTSYTYYASSSYPFENQLQFGFKGRSDGTAQQSVITGNPDTFKTDIDTVNGKVVFKPAGTNIFYAGGITYTVIIIPVSVKEGIADVD